MVINVGYTVADRLNCSCVLTLDGWRANYECLLEGFGLGTQLRWSGLQRNARLGQAGDVDGCLLVEARLIVEQGDVTAEGKGLASCRGHLENTLSSFKCWHRNHPHK